ADTYLNGTPKDPPPVRVADQVFTQFADEVARASGSEKREEFIASLREMVRQQPDFTTFPSSRRSGSYEEAIHTQVMAPLIPSESDRSRKGQPTPPTSCSGNPASLVSLAMKLSGKLPHELTEDDIMLAGQYEGSIISNVISEVFATYKVGQFIWAHKRIETEEVPYATVLAECRREYPPPWDILRDALAAMRTAAGDDGLFDFEFSDPDQHELNMANYEQFQFQTRMTNRTSGAQYDLNSLSSGERVLMALCLSSFNQQIGRRRPKLLLLDELDAVLHPSMVCALVATLKELFVARGTKVLLTSHSPMTVAALAETEIFRVERTGGRVRIGPTTRTDAIDELSEGIATVDAGLRIAAFDDAQVTILTEGNNARHLKRWVELHFPDGVRVFDQLNQHTSKSQLVAYGRLPGCMDSATHFVIVWDCDATGEAQKLRDELRQGAKVTPFAFRRLQGNQIARCGIENNYEDCVLKPYAIAKTDSDGHVFAYEFNGSRKKEFAEHVRQHATSEYFVHFEELRKVASDILATASPAGISEE
ncbi:MAG: AAA family ATPase, partial [Boseongicola sp. SB0673_bin_14]|nr:AAA family ATPase [Boseongicola sp. SB0673_bin_14]